MAHDELFDSPAFDAVVAAPNPPSDEDGGPCATCAFRPGTEANQTAHTVALAKLCVEGIEPFDCHEHKRLCRGWIAAVNLKAAAGEIGDDEESRRYRRAATFAANALSAGIQAGVAADARAAKERR